MGRGPLHLLQNGLADRLRIEHEVDLHTIRLSDAVRSEGQALVELQNRTVPIVRDGIGRGKRVLLLSGNCGPAALSAMGALNPQTTGVVWFDAHADFNTPETSASGFLDGMSLAILTGRCWPALAARLVGFGPVPEANVILVGTRDCDPLEATALSESAITTIPPTKMELLPRAVEALAERLENLYLHLDVDVLDNSEGNANSYASAGGISARELYAALEFLRQTNRIRVAGITSYDPQSDENQTVRVIIETAVTILAK
jgi:arginase